MSHGRLYLVDEQTRKDISWLTRYLPTYKGVFIMWLEQMLVPDACLMGLEGQKDKQYFHQIPHQILNIPNIQIVYFEMLAIIVGRKVWGTQLHGVRFRIYCDNEVVDHEVLNFGHSRDSLLQSLLREL